MRKDLGSLLPLVDDVGTRGPLRSDGLLLALGQSGARVVVLTLSVAGVGEVFTQEGGVRLVGSLVGAR